LVSGLTSTRLASSRAVDGPTEAGSIDMPLGPPKLGAHGLSYHAYEGNPATITLDLRRRRTGRSLVVIGMGGLVSAFATPVDRYANVFLPMGPILNYIPYPTCGNAFYVCENYRARSRLKLAATKQVDPGGEMTFAAVEVLNASKLVALSINYPKFSQPQRSDSVTTTGPALLLAWWWGDADGKIAHRAQPGEGFVVIESILLRGGLVQCCLAYKTVDVPGRYEVTWQSSPTQGAILWLAAIQ
jgi:hypothetical protein